jgi:hypothetical protein
MGKCTSLSGLVFMLVVVVLLALMYNCDTVDAVVFQCDECASHCTQENALWFLLIVSLPIILVLQYMIDHEEAGRQPRVIYITS